MTENENETYVSQRLAEHLDGSGGLDRRLATIPHEDLRRLLVRISESWETHSSDDLPDDFKDTAVYSTLSDQYGSDFLHRLLEQENTAGLGFYLGDDSDTLDASHMETLDFLPRLLSDGSDDSFAIYGERDSAKSSFAGQIVRTLADEKDAVVISNCECKQVDETVTSMKELADLALGDSAYIGSHYNGGTPPRIPRERNKIFWFAEASTYCKATRYAHELDTQYFPYMHRFAKLNVSAVYEFHGRMTSHAVFRRSDNVSYYVYKDDQKTAEIYEYMSEDSGDFSRHVATLENIQKPPSSLVPHTDDPSPWKWNLKNTLV